MYNLNIVARQQALRIPAHNTKHQAKTNKYTFTMAIKPTAHYRQDDALGLHSVCCALILIISSGNEKNEASELVSEVSWL